MVTSVYNNEQRFNDRIAYQCQTSVTEIITNGRKSEDEDNYAVMPENLLC